MREPSNSNVLKMVGAAMGWVLFLYLPNSLAGYLSFCGKTVLDYTDNSWGMNWTVIIQRIY